MAEGQKKKLWLDDDLRTLTVEIVLRCFSCSGVFLFLLVFIDFILFIVFIVFQVSTTYNAAGVTDLELTTSLADGSTEPQSDSIQISCIFKQRSTEQECKEWTKLKVNQDLKMEDQDFLLFFGLCCNQWRVSVVVHIFSKSRLPQAYGYVGAECSTSFAQNIFKHSLNWVSGHLWNHHWHPQANLLFKHVFTQVSYAGVLLPFSPRAFSASAGERNTVVSLVWNYRRIGSTWDTVMVTVCWNDKVFWSKVHQMSALNECPNHIEPAFDLTQVQQTVLGVVSGALKRAGNDGKL